jgi:hypothetical protein
MYMSAIYGLFTLCWSRVDAWSANPHGEVASHLNPAAVHLSEYHPHVFSLSQRLSAVPEGFTGCWGYSRISRFTLTPAPAGFLLAKCDHSVYFTAHMFDDLA